MTSPILSLDDLRDRYERERLFRRRLLAALPNLPTIRMDPPLATADEIGTIAYAYWPGAVHNTRVASQLVINASRDAVLAAEPDPRVTGHPECPSRLHIPLRQSLYRVAERLGREPQSVERFIAVLRPFGIATTRAELIRRDRQRPLGGIEEQVARILTDVFCHVLDPQPDPRTEGFVRANLARDSRGRAGYAISHEHNTNLLRSTDRAAGRAAAGREQAHAQRAA